MVVRGVGDIVTHRYAIRQLTDRFRYFSLARVSGSSV